MLYSLFWKGEDMLNIPSPAVAVVGRHNSGKTTLIVKLIAELTRRGIDVGSVKHHHRTGFEFDVPGKDSYRHREAGASGRWKHRHHLWRCGSQWKLAAYRLHL